MSEPASTLYDRLGGAEGIKRLVSAYLEALTTTPDYAPLCALYVNGLERYEERMNEFLSGWLGGPALYQERHGMPMLRESHRSIPITGDMAESWVLCMRQALRATVEDEELMLRLDGLFTHMAESLRNA
ncbi:group II truncated hemoglobin [Sutterella megalosphaeroides]|uniref:Globin n=1 Tax=Sutterella megalosphaeroides TaxID=2494234 RepID=A0A2Z6I7I4_9BURK|nr:group II truncated hemoglobin [Sutterella megalosphaeroides]BBF22354.1 globin [Sutterella megalosphaeroides]